MGRGTGQNEVQTTAGSRPGLRVGLCALLLATVLSAWAPARADAFVYWTNFNPAGIGRANLDATGPNQTFISHSAHPLRVAVAGQFVYWSTFDNNTIARANLDGSGVNLNFLPVRNPISIAVNATHIYWTDESGGTIGRANIDGTGKNDNFITGATSPAGIALDATRVYWTNFRTGPDAIGRANLNGTSVNQAFMSTSGAADSVAVDASFIYWADTGAGTIGRANINGTGANASFITGASSPSDMDVSPTHIYWVNPNNATIGRAALNGTGVNQSFITTANGPRGVAVDAGTHFAPTVTTDPASSVTAFGAALRSTINPGGAETTYKYEYGPTTAFGTVVPASGTFSAGSGATAVSQPPQTIGGLSPGTTYYYRVCANNEVTGAGVANQLCGAVRAFTTTGTDVPSVSTGAASAVANTTAQVSGSVNAHGAATAYVFEYGTSTAFGQIAPLPAGSAGSSTTNLAVSATLSGLQQQTTYFYRLVATNSQGTTAGTVRVFTTGPPQAAAVTTGAANITVVGGTLSGTVDPNGQATSFTFEYGPTTSFGQITRVDSAGDHNGVLNVSLPVSGLSRNTTYRYRIVATNAAGTTRGDVRLFTTPAAKPIFWANRDGGTIGVAGDDGTGATQTFITGASGPFGLAVNSSHIFWANIDNGTIGRANLDGSGVNQSFITGASTPDMVAVDSGHIYWTERNSARIARANLDGTGVNHTFINLRDVFAGLTATPEGLAVDSGHIYWGDLTRNSIGRANLDGTGVNRNFITGPVTPFAGAEGPGGIAVNSSHIYWSNFYANSIGRANLDGTGVNQSFITGANRPSGVAVDSGRIFWSNFIGNTIGRANLDGTGVNQNLVGGANGPVGVAVTASG